MKKGIDVSKHNGKIDWTNVKGQIDFVMIRAGYGKNNIDEKLYYNVKGCKENNIDFGFYWFSYALNKDMVLKEADYLCDVADKYKPEYPLAFDWEYDSDNYAKKKGVTITNDTRINFARTFLKEVEKRGYFAINYSNRDYYLYKGFNKLNEFALWLAEWSNKPSIPCEMWQNTNKAKYNGIAGYVDGNICYIDFGKSENMENKTKTEETTIEIFNDKIKQKYVNIVNEILSGKYGNGEERKKNLQNLGIDYEFAQGIINKL